MIALPRIASILILLVATCAAFATDYRLSVNLPAAQLANARSLQVYGFKFAKGDRIVSVSAGREGGSTGFRATVDSSSLASKSLGENPVEGFAGKVQVSTGQAPTKSVFVAIDKVVPGAAASEGGGLLATIKGFVTSMVGYITLGCLALLSFAAFFILRPKAGGGESWALPNRRKAIDESLKDITKRLEQMDKNQRELVKKPPVLRSFRNQIAAFESKLKQLEGQLGSIQGMIVKTGESLGALDRGQSDLRSRSESNDNAVRGLASSLDSAKQSVTELHQALGHLSQQQALKSDEVLSSVGKQALEIQSRLAGIEKGHIESNKSQEELHSTAKNMSDRIDNLKHGSDALQHSLKQVGEELSKIHTRVEEGVSPLRSEISNLHGLTESLRTEQKGVVEQLTSLTAKEVDLTPVQTSLAELKNSAEALQAKQIDLDAKLVALAAKEIDLKPVTADLAALNAAAESLKENQASLAADVAALASKEIDLAPVQAGMDEIKGSIETLQQEQTKAAERLAASKEFETNQAKALAKGFEELSKENEKARAAMLWSAEQAFSADDKKRLLSLAEHQTAFEAGLKALGEKIEKLDSSPASEELAELAARQKDLADALHNLSEQLSELKSAAAESASGIESKIAEVSARTDQRESILLSLQSRVSDSEGQSDGASEVLPVIADLRLELQSLAADQSKVSSTLEGLSKAVSAVGASADAKVQSLVENHAELAASLSAIEQSLDSLRQEPSEAPAVPAFDDSKLQESFEALSASLSQWKSESEASQKALEDRLAAAVASADGNSIPLPAFDEAKFQASFESLSASLSQWKAESEASQKALEDRLAAALNGIEGTTVVAASFDEAAFQSSFEALTASLAEWKSETEASHRALEERLAAATTSAEPGPVAAPSFTETRLQATIESLSASLGQWKSDIEASQKSFELRISSEMAMGFKHANASSAEQRSVRPKESTPSIDVELSHFEKPVSAPEIVVPDLELTDEKPVLHIDTEASVEEALGEAPEELLALPGWPLLGGSAARRWSTAVERPITVVASDKHTSALTPIVTPPTDFKLGPVLYMGKKVLFGHGPNLKGMWPGKGESSASLQEEMPQEPWRIATLDGHAFCVEEDQVEIVNLATWHVVARMSGCFIDQITTKTHWVGLGSAMGQLSLDYRNVRGRQMGEPVKLPIAPDQALSLAAEGERVFVGARDGRIYKVELGEVKEIVSAGKGDCELLSISVSKSALIVLARENDTDSVRVYGFDGKPQKQFALGFKHGHSNPVIVGDSMYLIDVENRKLMVCGLKKLVVSEAMDLPGDEISAFCGMFNADQHALLISIAEKESPAGKVIAVDPKSGATRVICEVSERNVQIVVAEARVVVAASTFYQNMIRVFDPFVGEAQKAA